MNLFFTGLGMNHSDEVPWWRSLLAFSGGGRQVGLVLGILLAAVLLIKYNPVGNRWFPPCPFRFLTGWYCPGCGSTRALHHLLHGRVGTAFGYNVLMVSFVPFLLVNGVARKLAGGRARLFDEKALSPVAIVAMLVVIVLFGVVRNLPMYPFGFFAPHG